MADQTNIWLWDGSAWVKALCDSAGRQKMSYEEYLIEVVRGNVPGQEIVHKFGRNQAIPSGTFEALNLISTAASFRTSAATMRVKAGGHANDDDGGSGAQGVTLQGVDDALAKLEETLITNGASASTASTAKFWRVYRAYLSAVGTYTGANTAIITIEDSGGASDEIIIGAGEGQSQHGQYATAQNQKAYLLSALITVDSNKPADIRLFKRENLTDVTTPFSPKRLVMYFDGIATTLPFKPRSPVYIADGLADIWWEAEGSGAASEVAVDFELLIIDD